MVALTPSAPARARAASRRSRRATLIAWGFAAPFVILFLVFMAGPIVASLLMSFTDLTTRDLQTPSTSTSWASRTTRSSSPTRASCGRC